MKKLIDEIAREDGRYNVNALAFVHDGLGITIKKIRDAQEVDPDYSEPRHISGQELSMGLANLASERWGRLAKMVLNSWGIKTSRDMGEIVYLMIKNEWMTAQENDTIEDFNEVFDFEEIFEKQYGFEKK